MIQNLDRRLFLGLSGAGAVAGAPWRCVGCRSPSACGGKFSSQHAPCRLAQAARRAALSHPAPGRHRAPFTSPLNKEHRQGTFVCAGCDLPLFPLRRPNMTAAPAGRASGSRFPMPSHSRDTTLGMVADRGTLPPLRRPSRPHLRRRPQADRQAPLHQRPVADLPPRLGCQLDCIGLPVARLAPLLAAAFGQAALKRIKMLGRIGAKGCGQQVMALKIALRPVHAPPCVPRRIAVESALADQRPRQPSEPCRVDRGPRPIEPVLVNDL